MESTVNSSTSPGTKDSVSTLAQKIRACTVCARAKTKCLWSNAGASCDRCQRLGKECQPVTIPARRGPKPKGVTKTARLEQKLDGLVSLLQSGGTSANFTVARSSTAESPPALPSPESLQATNETPQDHLPSCLQPTCAMIPEQRSDQSGGYYIQGGPRRLPVMSPETAYSVIGTRSSTVQSPEKARLEPSLDQAEISLSIFRAEMLPNFPFFALPLAMTAQDLRSALPFLWMCIMSIASRDTDQQRALGTEMRIALGREMLVEGKSNLDMLLGVLTYVAWGQYHTYDKPILVTLMHVAQALAANLGIAKPSSEDSTHKMLNYSARGCPKSVTYTERTMHERRALLGFFFISSEMTAYFQRSESLRWTPYLEECLDLLAEKREYPGDELLIHLVRLSLINEKLAQAISHENLGDSFGYVRAPPTYYLRELQSRLRDCGHNTPVDLQQNDIILLHYDSIELSVHEIALSKPSSTAKDSSIPGLDSLYTCLQTIKHSFNLLMDLPVTRYPGLPFFSLTHFAHCIICLYRLSTFECPDWNRGFVRDTCNLSFVLDEISKKFAAVKVTIGMDKGCETDKDTFNFTARTIRGLKMWWDGKVEAEAAKLDNEAMTDFPPMNFADDAWLTDMLTSGDFQFDPILQT